MDWSIIYFFLFLFSLVVLIVGTKNPKIIFPKSNISSIRYFLANLFVTFIFLSLSIGSSPVFKSEISKPNLTPTITSEPSSQPQSLGESIEITSIPKGDKVKISNVIDGDTVKTESGKVIRLIGIDAPETPDSVACYAKESTEKLEELILNKEVELEKDISETDKYDRLLRYIWVGDTLINEVLVREGFTKVSTYPPDVKYQTRFIDAEKVARAEKKGLWGSACISTPTSTPKSKATSTPKPTIKVSIPIPTQVIYNPPATLAPATGGTGGSWECNCSKTCPNMSSCTEAQYQLNVCGCGARDADKDGIACDADCQ